jgi:predicted nucleotidyltransferase
MSNRALTVVADTAAKAPGLDLLVLFGSRARGDVHARSDWDLGYLASAEFDPDALLASLVTATGSDKVDLVDLTRAGGLLRYRAARDGQVVFERAPQIFARFWLEVVDFWCDASPMIRRGYDRVLGELGGP